MQSSANFIHFPSSNLTHYLCIRINIITFSQLRSRGLAVPHTVSPRPLTAESGFNPRPTNTGFMVDKVALRHVFTELVILATRQLRSLRSPRAAGWLRQTHGFCGISCGFPTNPFYQAENAENCKTREITNFFHSHATAPKSCAPIQPRHNGGS